MSITLLFLCLCYEEGSSQWARALGATLYSLGRSELLK